MICEMRGNGRNPSCDEEGSYEDVESEYEAYKDETGSDISLFPDTRDYDAEDEDGLF